MGVSASAYQQLSANMLRCCSKYWQL